MKLQHLPMGARFEFEGQIFVKTGPLTAAAEKGGQRMIPRSAILKPLDPIPAPPPPSTRKLDEARVLAAFDTFCRSCTNLVDEAGRMGFEKARQQFLSEIR